MSNQNHHKEENRYTLEDKKPMIKTGEDFNRKEKLRLKHYFGSKKHFQRYLNSFETPVAEEVQISKVSISPKLGDIAWEKRYK